MPVPKTTAGLAEMPSAVRRKTRVKPRSSARKKTVLPSAENFQSCGERSAPPRESVSLRAAARWWRVRRVKTEKVFWPARRPKTIDWPSGAKTGLVSEPSGLSVVRLVHGADGSSILL